MDIPTTAIDEKLTTPGKNKDAYLVYVVFELPQTPADTSLRADQNFLHTCLHTVQTLNELHIHDGTARSHEYFTSLNHSERTRIPKALKRLNVVGEPTFYGILAFQAFRSEPVKNKAFNQRVTSINPDILVFDRLHALFVPLSYPCDLSLLGHPITHEQPGFIQVNILTHRFISN